MRIIKMGDSNDLQMEEKERKGTCHECGCIFTYTDSDINIDQKENDVWVNCPCCKYGIDIRI